MTSSYSRDGGCVLGISLRLGSSGLLKIMMSNGGSCRTENTVHLEGECQLPGNSSLVINTVWYRRYDETLGCRMILQALGSD